MSTACCPGAVSGSRQVGKQLRARASVRRRMAELGGRARSNLAGGRRRIAVALRGWRARRFAAVLAGFAAAAALLAIPADGLAENLWVEGAGALASIALAVMLVEPLILRARREEWQQFREHYVTAIGSALERVGYSFANPLDPERRGDFHFSDPPREEALEAFRRIRDRAEELRFEPTLGIDHLLDVALRVADEDLKDVRETLLPRVLDLSDDPRLVHLMLSLEASELDLRTSVRRWKKEEADADVYGSIMRGAAVRFLQGVTETYAHLLELRADSDDEDRAHS
jgi:hypothetical protein